MAVLVLEPPRRFQQLRNRWPKSRRRLRRTSVTTRSTALTSRRSSSSPSKPSTPPPRAYATVSYRFDSTLLIEDLFGLRFTFLFSCFSEKICGEIWLLLFFLLRIIFWQQWNETYQHFDKVDPKQTYYLSMEYLQGRALTNAIGNLNIQNAYADALNKLGHDLEEIVEQVSLDMN